MCIDHKRLIFFLAGTAAVIAEGELVNGHFVFFLEGSAQHKVFTQRLCIKLCPLSTNKNDHSLMVHDLANTAWRWYIPLKNYHIIKVSVLV